MSKEAEAQAYLEEIGKNGSILGLESIQGLMGELGNVHRKLKLIHVAGTNGKGSVCAMVSSILQEAGFRVGMYTSPAVFERTEQYQVNGAYISHKDFAEVILKVKAACGRMRAKGKKQPTVFEVETAAAFVHFYQQHCQLVVLETGMGGETDATNVIDNPLVSVLTSISMDHMKFLGSSLEQIAAVKAGIIKEGGLVVASKPRQRRVQEILENTCAERHASLTYAQTENAGNIRICKEGENMGAFCFSYGALGQVTLSMPGVYQVQNAVCAIEAIKMLQRAGYVIEDAQIKKGIAKARWEGRFSILCKEPLFIIDGAHNEDAAEKLAETLKRGFTNYKIIYIIGVLADKEHEKMLKIMLPMASQVLTITPDSPRAMDGRALALEAKKYHKNVAYCQELSDAVRAALDSAKQEKSMILAFGSLSYLKELREALKENQVYDR